MHQDLEMSRSLAGRIDDRAAERHIARRCTGLGDQRALTRMLGLDAAPAPKAFSPAERRAAPDGFRRGRSGRRS